MDASRQKDGEEDHLTTIPTDPKRAEILANVIALYSFVLYLTT